MGTEIVSTEPGLHRVATRPLRGRLTAAQALERLLAGSDYRAIPGRWGGYRVVAAPATAAPRRILPPARPSHEPTPADIVVTASKQRVPLLRYPGSLTMVTGAPMKIDGSTGDVSDLTRPLPILQSTQLGPGRNKVFIRGIADSSFAGTTQSTASVYLDDVQLNASGPDPALRLYDMRAIEVMEGPQGTLYGAGAIGGVLRLVTNAPVLGETSGWAGGGVTATRGGGAGFDVAARANIPLAGDRLAMRALAYAVRDGDYVDDTRRRLSGVNRTDTLGMRAAVRADPGGGWRIDVGGVAQGIDSRDGQYAVSSVGTLARRNAIAQPFEDRFLFGRATVTRTWDSGLTFVSATGVAHRRSRERFDATPPGASAQPPLVYSIDNDKLLLSQELRLSRSMLDGGSWLAGFTFVSDRSVLSRTVGTIGSGIEITGVSNLTRAASGFAEVTLPLIDALSVTLGGRYTTARVDGEPSATRRPNAVIKGRETQRFDPTIALSYRVAPSLAAFARYQTGFRTGGLAVAQGIGRVANFEPDAIRFAEVGLRRLRGGATGIGATVSMSAARWSDIQADLLHRRGQPFTTNLGDATIQTVEAAVDWMPTTQISVAASALYTHNMVTGPIADQSRRDNRRLPDTPPFAAHGAIGYAWSGAAGDAPRVTATVDYVGRSVLGTGDLLDVSQGDYVTIGVVAAMRWHDVDWTAGIDNLTDTQANRFAFGNPFGLALRNQTTPLRPRSLRIGIARRW